MKAVRQFSLILLGTSLAFILLKIYLNPALLRSSFVWIVSHPCVPACVISCVLAIHGLLAKKDLKRALLCQAASMGLLFHDDLLMTAQGMLHDIALLIKVH